LLRAQFRGTPYPPTGAAARALALSKLVGRVEWVAGNATLNAGGAGTLGPQERSVMEQVAETLRRCADLVCDGSAHPVSDQRRVDAVTDCLRQLEEELAAELDTDLSRLLGAGMDDASPAVRGATADAHGVEQNRNGSEADSFASVLDPSFHVRALGTATAMVADAALASAGAETFVDSRLGLGLESTSRNTA
jgi:hypothetical protein